MWGRPLKSLTHWRWVEDLRSVRALCLFSLIVWMVSAVVVWWMSCYEGYSFQISVIEVVLPLVSSLWVGFVVIFALVQCYTRALRRHAYLPRTKEV